MELYPHNARTYQAVADMLNRNNRACVIHPTGTGKSFIAFALMKDRPDASFLWLARQRSAKRNPGKNTNCVLTAERIEKLEKIGVVWDET